MIRSYLAVILVGFACLGAAQDTPRPAATSLSLDDVVAQVKSGAPEEAIVARIRRHNKAFDLNEDEIKELQKAGVSGPVIGVLLDPAAPYTPPTPAPRLTPAQPGQPLKDPLMLKIPPEPGIYWLASDASRQEMFTVLEFKPIIPLKASSGMVAKLKGPLKGGDRIGFLSGASAGVRVGISGQVFYVRLGPKAAIDDIVMIRMEKAGQRRLLDFGTKPDKPVFAPESILPFESTLLAEGIYRLNVKSIGAGEYVLLVLGSGDEKKGVLGKGYEFSAGALPN